MTKSASEYLFCKKKLKKKCLKKGGPVEAMKVQ
jgi:hypothetical protein